MKNTTSTLEPVISYETEKDKTVGIRWCEEFIATGGPRAGKHGRTDHCWYVPLHVLRDTVRMLVQHGHLHPIVDLLSDSERGDLLEALDLASLPVDASEDSKRYAARVKALRTKLGGQP